MIYPNIWGRGAIFAFSGLEGATEYEKNMDGQLMGERIGITFDRQRVDLYLRLIGVGNFDYSIVASDIILGRLKKKDFGFFYVNNCAVVGFCPTEKAIVCLRGDFAEEKQMGDCKVLVHEDYSYALVTKKCGDKTVFALGKGDTPEEACGTAEDALTVDIDSAVKAKLAYFERVPETKGLSEDEQRTLAKCFSVMKSQVYSPEAPFKHFWTTPDRLPHKKCWLWDSVLHSIGNFYLDPQLAYESLRSIMDTQDESNGFIPIMATPNFRGLTTQPPILAWGFYELYKKTGRKEWLAENYDGLEKYLKWDMENRDRNNNYLYEWYVNPNTPYCSCGESGMDNTPRFDGLKELDSVDFSAYMANEARCMKKISEALGKTDRAEYYDDLFNKIKGAMNRILYNEEDGRYYDCEIETGKHKKVQAESAFTPLFAGVCTKEIAERLVKDLFDPETFGRPFGVPSISAKEPTYGGDMWRGPVWINFNYFIIQGLMEYGYVEEARALRQMTLDNITKWYLKDGVIYEFYDSEKKVSSPELSRKGPALKPEDPNVRVMAIRDFGWSTTLCVAMAMEKEAERE